MNNSNDVQCVIVYIDGYNLYYGRHAAFGNRYKWLGLQAFSESFLRHGMQIVAVRYFTAITKSNTGAKQRQEIYLKVLIAHCEKLESYYGRFLSKQRKVCVFRSTLVRHS